MNIAELEKLAGPETAGKLADNDYYNNVIQRSFQEIDPERLDDMTRGGVILGVETIDYPETDGVYIYMRRPAGDVMALFIEAGTDEQNSGGYGILQISKAMIE